MERAKVVEIEYNYILTKHLVIKKITIIDDLLFDTKNNRSCRSAKWKS